MLRNVAMLVLVGLFAAPEALADNKKDGWQVVVGVGGGFGSTGVTTDPAADGAPEITASGMGVAGMVLVGKTLSPGLSVGLAPLMGFDVFSPTVEIDGTEAEGSDPDPMAGNIAGIYADYYLSDAGGLHFLGQLGFATLTSTDSDVDDVATGFGATLGLGYDMYMADDVSVGGLLRFQYLSTSLEKSGVTFEYTTTVPALVVTAAWH